MNIKKDDMVKVITGRDKGKTGRVVKVFPKKDRLIVEGLNLVKKTPKTYSRKSARRSY